MGVRLIKEIAKWIMYLWLCGSACMAAGLDWLPSLRSSSDDFLLDNPPNI